jgi:ADP-dependent NAD(P)H-hydrate dehydratase / NAD(P)H-hydrate epimerase
VKVVTSAQMRELEVGSAALGLPGPALMEIAGRAIADEVARLLSLRSWRTGAGGVSSAKDGAHRRGREIEPGIVGQRVLVLAGPGNNGGDGLVAARHLHDLGARVVVYLVLRADGDEAKIRLVRSRGIPVASAADDSQLRLLSAWLDASDVVLDAVLGIGKSRPASGLLKSVLDAVNGRRNRSARVIAVDVPTGLNADTGAIDPSCLRADATITLGSPKRGLFLPPGLEAAGAVSIIDIGIPPGLDDAFDLCLTTPDDARRLLPARTLGAHKGTFGKAMIVGGSATYTGAPTLAALGALRVGAGLVTLAVPRDIRDVIAGRLLEPTYLPLPSDSGFLGSASIGNLLSALPGYCAALVGPGLGRQAATAGFLDGLLDRASSVEACQWVVDADGLTLLAGLPDWAGRLPRTSVLTPHPGEMARLTGETALDRIDLAREKSREWGHVVVLKGAYTIVASPDGRASVNPVATSALATAGTGDVLAGAIVGLLAQGLPAYEAALLGAYLHGRAGELLAAERGLAGGVASEVAEMIPRARGELADD